MYDNQLKDREYSYALFHTSWDSGQKKRHASWLQLPEYHHREDRAEGPPDLH